VTITKNKFDNYEVEGLKYQHQKFRDIHYFNCEWSRLKEGGECDALLVTEDFNLNSFKEGDTCEVFLLKFHSK